MDNPVLYTFRRCPYCLRAHMALKYSGITIELREVELKSMPDALLEITPNKTVPVLQRPDGTVMDESWDIVKWALSQNDPDLWLGEDQAYLLDTEILVETNDYSFKDDLDHYKYADRFPEHSEEYYRQRCEVFLEELEEVLSEQAFLASGCLSVSDIAVFPFIRQFSLVDKTWFDQSPYVNVRRWLEAILETDLFKDVFKKHALWQAGDPVVLL